MKTHQIQYKNKIVRIFSSKSMRDGDYTTHFHFIQSSPERRRWQDEAGRDLVEVIKKGELSHLLGFICLSAFYERFTFLPKGATLEGFRNDQTQFIGRAPHIPLLRAWRKTKGKEKALYLTWLMSSVVRPPLRNAKESGQGFDYEGNLAHQHNTMKMMPQVENIYIQETLDYLLACIEESEEQHLNILVHACFSDPLRAYLENKDDGHLVSKDALLEIPSPSAFSKSLPWIITAIIIIAFVLGCIFTDFEKMKGIVIAWVAVNSILTGIGTMLAGAHPITIMGTAISAPFVSLNPAIGAGMVGSFIQAMVRPPSVEDIQNVGEELMHFSGWWKNKLARLLLIFFAANLFSTIGSFLALAFF